MSRGWGSNSLGTMENALDQSPDPSELWPRYTSFGRGASSSSGRSLGRRQIQGSPQRNEGRSKTGTASLPQVKLAPMNAPGPTGERQEHLDAIIAFAGAGILDILTLLSTQLMFLKKEKNTLQTCSTMTSGFDLSRKRRQSPQASQKSASRTTKVR